MEQELHPIFNTELDLFNRIKEPTVAGQTTLNDLITTIKYSINVDSHLIPKYLYNGKLNPDYDKLKHRTNCTTLNASFNGYKDLNYLKSCTGLMFLDLTSIYI